MDDEAGTSFAKIHDEMETVAGGEVMNSKRKFCPLIETVMVQLSERFNIEKDRVRDLWHLTVRIGRKLLEHTVNCFINWTLGNSVLQFEKNRAVKNLHTASLSIMFYNGNNTRKSGNKNLQYSDHIPSFSYWSAIADVIFYLKI